MIESIDFPILVDCQAQLRVYNNIIMLTNSSSKTKYIVVIENSRRKLIKKLNIAVLHDGKV